MNRSARKPLGNFEPIYWLVLLALASAIPATAQSADATADDQTERVVLVSLVDRKLAVIQDGVVIATFQVAVGADVSPSPTGEFRIVSRVQNPTYYRPGTIIPAGKDNPVGTRWMGLSRKGLGIHGTNAPNSIGRAASHGCIRLRNRDVEQLFTMLRIGDVVQIRGERDEQIAGVFGTDVDPTIVADARVAPASSDQQEGSSHQVGLGN
jgi:lipoprotein-anchoring transpeptidase ErfK/SrfK